MKKKVFIFSDGNYNNIVLESHEAVLEWIKADLDSGFSAIGDEFEYTVVVSEMTEEEIANLPEAD